MASVSFPPFLHDLLVCLHAPVQFWSAPNGEANGRGAEGLYYGDTRVLSRVELTVNGRSLEAIMGATDGSDTVRLVAVARDVDRPGADPTLRIDRDRHVTTSRVRERITVTSATTAEVGADVRVSFASDLATMGAVRGGHRTALVAARRTDEGVSVVWATKSLRAVLRGKNAEVDVDDTRAPALKWYVRVAPGAPLDLGWELSMDAVEPAVVPATSATPEWAIPTVRADDRRFPMWLDQALGDLSALRMAIPARPEDTFLAAGAPWFFTLFGRDSIWAARMLLPLGTELACGTLRALASLQGRVVDRETAEEPGKIPHEVRSPAASRDVGLPPLYYGTIDATPLWICLLHDAWRWGLAEHDVAELIPDLERALGWMRDHGDADGDGFFEYFDYSGHGLANQGWKDSHDSIQWRDGRLADGPIALCEVQGYAYEAALAGAALLEAFDRSSAEYWREWAGRLAERFRTSFWVDGPDGPHPAVALDRDKRPVDTLTSNIGHLLGTGLLNAVESDRVAALVSGPELNSGFGLRTMARGSAGYWPLSYHGGSVWPHDTAITIGALTRSGHGEAAASLLDGLLSAAPAFDYRLPELYGGDSRSDVPRPVPYPAACRPQAWSASAAVAALSAVVGLAADVPAGRVSLRPLMPSPVGSVQVDGLRLGTESLSIDLGADGHVRRVDAPAGIKVIVAYDRRGT